MKRNSGQSLIEVLMGLAIGALLIGAASIAVAFVLRSGATLQTINTATQLSQDLLNKVKTFSLSSWGNVYNLQHSTSTINPYFLVASGTGFIAAQGEEGVIDNEIKNGLVGKWGFDEGTGTITYDESSYMAKNLTLVNNPTWVSGKISGALNFNGSSTYAVNNTGGFLPTGSSARTIAFWFYPVGAPSHPAVIAYGCSTEGYGCSDYGQGRYISVEVSASYDAINTETCAINGPPVPVPQQSWHFYTAVFNGDNTVTFYMDGVNKLTTIAPCTINTASGNGVSIGVGRWGYYSGSLDDVRVYNRALSASEIKQLYNSSVFRRYFYIKDVCRNTNGTLDASATLPCSGNDFDDPSTQQATAVTEWDAAGKTSNFTLVGYLTRWSNFTFNQSDWSGGTNTTGVFSVPSNQYASATNITTSNPLGTIEIQNLTQQ